MAEKHHPQFEFCYKKVELLKRESLGSGSYGAVCKAMCDDLPCAAKILHPTLLQLNVPGTMMNVMQKFEQECRLLSAIKHPHIVQYLGTYCDPESRLPVLLMELMDESLTRFLKRSHEQLSYHTEVNLCHDIALALSYLHPHGIIHRDLSSNNVLLIAGSRAKVADFGMAKLFDMNNAAHLTPLTLCPGTMVYMSPEALRDRPVYTDKLDSFSLGVLCVQIMTRMIPNPSDRVTIVADSRAPAGRIEVPVSEIERRRSHINLITQEHPLLLVALACLQDEGEKRPSAQEICCHIAQLKTATLYKYSVQMSQAPVSHSGDKERQITKLCRQHSQQVQRLELEVQSKEEQLLANDKQLRAHLQQKEQETQQQEQQIQTLKSQLTATTDQLQTHKQHLTTKDEQLAGKDQQLARKNHQLQRKEAAIAAGQQEIQQLRQQLQSSEQVTAEFQQNLLKRESTIREMRQKHTQQVQTLQLQLRSKDEQLLAKDDQLHTHLQQKEEQQRQQIQALQDRLTATNDQLQTVQQQLANKDKRIADKDEQTAGIKQKLVHKDHWLQQKEAIIVAHQQEIQELRQQLHSREKATAEFRIKTEKTIKGLQEQHTQQLRTLQLQLQSKEEQLLAKDKQLLTHLRQREQEIQQQQQQQSHPLQDLPTATSDQLQTLQQRQSTKDEQLAAHQHKIQQPRQHLQPSEQVTAEFQFLLEKEETIRDQQKQTQELQQQQQPRQRGGQRLNEVEADEWEELDASGAVASGAVASGGSIKLQWKDGEKAPYKMWGKVATVNGSIAYFSANPQNKNVYSFDSSNKKWSELPECSNCGFSLAIVNSLLTAIGGKMPNREVTNSLLTLTDNKWTEKFPPMPTKRWLTAVMCNNMYLAVAGGVGEKGKYLNTVEVMDIQSQPPQWSIASSLPHPLIQATATICGGQVYTVGGQDQNREQSKSVFTCSMTALLQSCQPQSLGAKLLVRLRTLALPQVWHKLANTPYCRCTCASLRGQLLAVGGMDSDDKETTAIHMYNTTTNSWEVISDMATIRSQCLVAVLPHNELMVVGGRTSGDTTDSVEFLTIV